MGFKNLGPPGLIIKCLFPGYGAFCDNSFFTLLMQSNLSSPYINTNPSTMTQTLVLQH